MYHSIIEEARSRRLNLIVLTPSQPIPVNVRVIITTEDESEDIDFSRDRIVIVDKPQATLDKAISLLFGEDFEQVIIGIDPGKYPGMAVLGNNKTISVHHVSVGEVCPLIKRIMRDYKDKKLMVRIGHGARLIRSQLINGILDLGLAVEMVDETGTTPHLGKGVHGQVISDIIAAINIARIRGKNVGKQFIEPSQGEVRVIQEHSREYSNGRSTIPRMLARAVAKGELTMDEAVEIHKND
ncbi:MAG: hypothetical protein L6244_01275 [Candidatus Methanoperedenaceae archaeon]|nr:hypothetical protein [Candidatus Methanoperedenaceae archaeon]